jgi:hypothetical protein
MSAVISTRDQYPKDIQREEEAMRTTRHVVIALAVTAAMSLAAPAYADVSDFECEESGGFVAADGTCREGPYDGEKVFAFVTRTQCQDGGGGQPAGTELCLGGRFNGAYISGP